MRGGYDMCEGVNVGMSVCMCKRKWGYECECVYVSVDVGC